MFLNSAVVLAYVTLGSIQPVGKGKLQSLVGESSENLLVKWQYIQWNHVTIFYSAT